MQVFSHILSFFKNRKPQFILLLAITGFFFFLFKETHAQGLKTFKVGIYDNPPKEYLNDLGQAKGLFPDVLNFIAQKENWKIEYVLMPFSDDLTALEEGKIDMLTDIDSSSTERRLMFDFPQGVVINSWGIIFVREGSDIQSFSDLNGKKIAVLQSNVYIQGPEGILEYLSKFDVKAQIVEVPVQEDAFVYLAEGKVDAALVDRIFAIGNESKYPQIKPTDIYFFPTRLTFALQKGNPQNVYIEGRLDYWLSRLKNGDRAVFTQILKNNGLSGLTENKPIIPSWVYFVGLAILLIVIWLVFHISFLRKARNTAYQRLEESEELNKSLVEATDRSGIGTAIFQNVDGREAAIVSVNNMASKISGYSRNELLKMKLADVLPENVVGIIMERYKLRQQGKIEPYYYETEFINKEGIKVPIMVSPAVIKLNGKEATVVYFMDITQTKKTEQLLFQSEEKFRSIFEKSPLGIALLDKEMKFISANRIFAKMVGIPADNLKGKSVQDISSPDYHQRDKKAARELIEGKIQEFKSEEYIIQKNGQTNWHSISVRAIKDKEGKFLFFVTMLDDVTKVKKIQEALKVSERYYRQLVELSPDGIFIHSGGDMVYVNPAAQKLLGAKKKEEIVGKPVLHFIDPSYRKMIAERIRKLYSGEKVPTVIDEVLLKVDRSPIDVEVSSAPILYKDKPAVQGIIRDESQRVKAEKSLKEANKALAEDDARQKAIFQGMEEGIFVTDMSGNILTVNKKAEQLLGWKRGEMKGKPYHNFTLLDPAGKEIPTNKRPLMVTLRTGKTIFTNDYSVLIKAEKIDLSIITSPIMVKGKMVGGLAVFRDIRREKELDRAKSEFVSVASHQLRTPLGISKWYLEAMKDDDLIHKNPAVAAQYLNVIEDDNERLIALISDLLNVSRIEQFRVPDNPARTDIAKMTKEAIDHLKAIAIKKFIKLRFEDDTNGSIFIRIDQERFREVLECLISNSIKYSDAYGSVEVHLSKDDGNIKFSVTDHGIGITKADTRKIFTKFFRSAEAVKKDSEGTGLGLFVAKSYIEGWGGEIWFKSVPHKYTKFFFTLPLKNLQTE